MKFPTRLPLSSAIPGQHPVRAASGSLWLVHSARLQGHTRSAPRRALCQQDSPTLLGRLRVYPEVFHSLFFCDQLHEARGEMLFNSFHRQDTEGHTFRKQSSGAQRPASLLQVSIHFAACMIPWVKVDSKVSSSVRNHTVENFTAISLHSL